jgi:hypothetical protein
VFEVRWRRGMGSVVRAIAEPFVVAAPAGVRVRTRLRVSALDAQVLWMVGANLGSLAGRDLAIRCREGQLDGRQQAVSRRERKRALTGEASSRWAGAITRTSEDTYRLAVRNLHAERASLVARIKRVEARLRVPVGQRQGRVRAVRGYHSGAERHAKTVRAQGLRARLARVQAQIDAGQPSVVRGGRRLLHTRNHLEAAGLTEAEWRHRWESTRLFLTADGEADRRWGNETIRWHPGQHWLELKLPQPLSYLANRPHGTYRLGCTVEFTHRAEEVAAQAESGAVRYDISHDPKKDRWYLDASWRAAPARPPSSDELRAGRVVAVDLNADHLAVVVLAPDGNLLGQPVTIPLDLTGLTVATRDGRLRAAISRILAIAGQHQARAVVIENLNFTRARTEGREHLGNRPSRGARGRRWRRLVAGIPTARFRDRLTQMAHNQGVWVLAVDPAYTSRWGAEQWLWHLQRHHPNTSGHHAAALVIGRRGLGYRARRRVKWNRPAPVEAARSTRREPGGTRREGPHPGSPPPRTGPRQPPGTRPARLNRTRQATRRPTTVRGRPPSRTQSPLSVQERSSTTL